MLFESWMSNICSANTSHNFCCVRLTTLHSFIFPLHLSKLISFVSMTPEAEKFNGWMAMIGFIAAVGAYTTTGQIIPGIF